MFWPEANGSFWPAAIIAFVAYRGRLLGELCRHVFRREIKPNDPQAINNATVIQFSRPRNLNF